MKVYKEQALTNYNTLKTKDKAKCLVVIDDERDFKELSNLSNWQDEKKIIVGGGSNIILSAYLDAYVIHPRISNWQIVSENKSHAIARASCGLLWAQLVKETVSQGLFGLENLVDIPGHVGAAPVQNISAYGVDLAEFIKGVEVLNFNTMEKHYLNESACHFSYRDSIFKNELKENHLITHVDLKLHKNPKVFRCEYPDIQRWIKQHKLKVASLEPKDVLSIVSNIRKEKLPAPFKHPNVGSFFKNPVIKLSLAKALQKRFDDIPVYALSDGAAKISAAWMIEKCGWRGRKKNNVKISKQHSLVVINYGANGKEVLRFAEKVQQDVYEKFSILLSIEPRVFP